MPPSWTDANRSDPGITILQLLAYLTAALFGAIAVRLARAWFCARRASSGR